VSKEDWLLLVKLKKVFNINDQPKKKAVAATPKEKAVERDYNSRTEMPAATEDDYEDD
jgi:hypothetical protein